MKTRSEYNREWREKNKDHLRAKLFAWKKSNPEKIKAWRRRDYLKNRDKILKQSSDYQKAHPEIAKKSQVAYRAKFPERVKISQKKYADANPDKMKAKWARNMAKRKLRISATSDGTAESFYKWAYSRKFVVCYYCEVRISNKKFDVDHIIPLSKGGSHIASNLCVACDSCNSKKSSKLPSNITFINQPVFNF